MKRLFIRFFENKEDQIPKDSYPLCNQDKDAGEIDIALLDIHWNSAVWMKAHQNGKVDLVWL